MAALDELKKRLLTEIAVSLSDLFDRSFETKSFNGKPWKHRIPGNIKFKGTLLINSGALRRSIKHTVNGNTIQWTSNVPYAEIHNKGGLIKVTPKMKRYFWAMYYKYSKSVKKGKKGQILKASKNNNDMAEFYKNMALQKVGAKIWIRKRQFIGDCPEVRKRIKAISDKYFKKLAEAVLKQAKKH